jgi:Do/DeqQ family serine protease
MNQALKTLSISFVGAAFALGAYIGFVEKPAEVVFNYPSQQSTPVSVHRTPPLAVSDFSEAAEMTVNSVVHVNVAVERKVQYMNPFDQFFFGTPQQQSQIVEGSGSGVILSSDGYIVTNNHVIEGAKTIQVRLNDNRTFNAKLIGADPTTDLALLKVDATGLIPVAMGNSDEVRLGEWVLAVGNPFNLTSTVTAGIISAKGRNINIINNQSAIESFIQTDAAVNPGNSGGALVNTHGELIGINTAISTHTGSFEGYSFAVPVNIMKKVVEDLRLYGTVQRAFLGVNIADVTAELVKEQSLKTNSGVYVAETIEKGAAREAGIQRGDVIIKIDGASVSKTSELTEQIGRKRPGDVVKVTILRGAQEKTLEVRLKNQQGTTQLLSKDELLTNNYLGGKFESLSSDEKQAIGLRYGVKVIDPGKGNMARAGVPKGFIIVKINNQIVDSLEGLNDVVSKLNPGDGILIQGYHPGGKADYFAFGL